MGKEWEVATDIKLWDKRIYIYIQIYTPCVWVGSLGRGGDHIIPYKIYIYINMYTYIHLCIYIYLYIWTITRNLDFIRNKKKNWWISPGWNYGFIHVVALSLIIIWWNMPWSYVHFLYGWIISLYMSISNFSLYLLWVCYFLWFNW